MFYLYVAIESSKGRRPLTYRMTIQDIADYMANKAQYQYRAILHICANKGFTKRDLDKYGYTNIKLRLEKAI